MYIVASNLLWHLYLPELPLTNYCGYLQDLEHWIKYCNLCILTTILMDHVLNLILLLLWWIVALPTHLLKNLLLNPTIGLWAELNLCLFTWILAVNLYQIRYLLFLWYSVITVSIP